MIQEMGIKNGGEEGISDERKKVRRKGIDGGRRAGGGQAKRNLEAHAHMHSYGKKRTAPELSLTEKLWVWGGRRHLKIRGGKSWEPSEESVSDL